MDDRRKEKRQLIAEKTEKEYYRKKPKIADLFADAKNQLANVSESEWSNIPDIGDHSLRYKQKRQDSYTPVPDTLIAAQRKMNNSFTTTLDPRDQNGFLTPLSDNNISGIESVKNSNIRSDKLTKKLISASDDVSGKTNIDPQGYMTELNSIKVSSESEIADLKKARLLLKSMTNSNPKHGPGWIAAARLEEQAGKISEARKIIKEGCENCPENEDVWLEACRLQTPNKAKGVLANAVRFLPKSVKIWLKAADLENDINLKREVIRKAIEFIPTSVNLWKAAIELESDNEEDAKILLERAVECVPQSVEIWLALAKLEDYNNARNVLNRARMNVPTDPRIWIAGAQLEEANGNSLEKITLFIQRGITSLRNLKVEINRKKWLDEAENMERSGSKLSCIAIINNVLDIGIEEIDKKRTFVSDAEMMINNESFECARGIYSFILKLYPNDSEIWIKAIELEKKVNSSNEEEINGIIGNSLKNCSDSIEIWLNAVRYKYNKNNLNECRKLLEQAFEINKENEEFISNENLWFERIKLEWDNKEYDNARSLLKEARNKCINSKRIWLKSCLLEWEVKNYDLEIQLLNEAIDRFPTFDKLYMMKGQYYEENDNYTEAINSYKKGRSRCMKSSYLWILCSKLEEKVFDIRKARSTLEEGRIKNPNDDLLYYESILLEKRNKSEKKIIDSLLSKGLQDCPTSGLLYKILLEDCSKVEQKSVCSRAMEANANDGIIICTIAGIFAKNKKKKETAKKWYERALNCDRRNGDIYCKYFLFLNNYEYSEEEKNKLLSDCERNKPNKGLIWCSISKERENRHLDVKQIFEKVLIVLNNMNK